MAETYTYTISTQLPGGSLNETTLKDEIIAASLASTLKSVSRHDDKLKVKFETALSQADRTTLDATDQPNFLDIQTDSSLDPGGSPATGDRYLLQNTASLHANFGTITGVGDNDIVEFNGADFVVDFDSSANGSGKAQDDSDQVHYSWNGTTWSSVVPGGLIAAHDNTPAAPVYHPTDTSNPHAVTKAQVGLSNVANLKVKLDATAAPTTSDDSAAGYAVGSRWVDVTADKEYVCLDATATAAVWTETTGAGGGSHALGSATHTADTLANLNAKISDATLIDTGDSRLSDARTPTAHNHDAADINAGTLAAARLPAATEIAVGALEIATQAEADAGTADDKIITPAKLKNYTGTIDGRDVSADGTKLDGIEASADVTDATNVAAAGAVMDSDISAAEGFLRKTGAGAYEALKSNLNASVAPGATDDSAAGYAIGSVWIDTTADKIYQCADATATAAVWKDLSATGGGDADAIHDNVAGEISAIAEKTSPVSADLLIIEDSAASNAKKKVQIGNLPGGGGSAASRAFMSMDNNATVTTIGTINTPVKAAGATTAGALQDFTHASNRLTYTGADTADFLVCASGSVTCDTTAREMSWMLYKNGALVGAPQEFEAGPSAGNAGSPGLDIIVSLATNDYLEIWLENHETTDDLTLQDLNFSVVRADKTGPAGPTGATGAAGADGDITWQGAWATSTAYTTNQAVKHGGASYVCISGHTSSATDEPGAGASWETYWDLMAAKGDTGSAGIYGADYVETINRAQQSISSGTYSDVLSYTCPAGLNGTYRVETNGFVWNTDKLGYHRLYNDTDAVEEYGPIDVRIKTNAMTVSMTFDIVLSGSAKTFKWQYKDDIGSNTQYVKEARMRFYRVV